MSKRRIPAGNGSDHPSDAGPRTLIELAYTRLREDIVEMRLAAGSRLRIEHLRERYGVSAGTLREAITRLVSDALVEAEGQRGFRVAPMSITDLTDLTELRLHLELEALRRSIRQGDALWRQQLEQAYQALSACPARPEYRKQWEALNGRFHEVLISGQASPWTLRMWRILTRHGERYRTLAISCSQPQGRDVREEHRQIFDAAMDGNEARAALALEAHIRATLDSLVRADAHDCIFGSRSKPSGSGKPSDSPAPLSEKA
ncbi:MAG: FCD domain-containing protein [Rhodoferax sp.]